MGHFKDQRFDPLFAALPAQVQKLARKQFKLLKANPKHPSLHFKQVKTDLWSARVGRHYRALAVEVDGDFRWFWIGGHGEYDGKIR